jgi:hypothetical protein
VKIFDPTGTRTLTPLITRGKYLIFCDEIEVNSNNNSFKFFLKAATKVLAQLSSGRN